MGIRLLFKLQQISHTVWTIGAANFHISIPLHWNCSRSLARLVSGHRVHSIHPVSSGTAESNFVCESVARLQDLCVSHQCGPSQGTGSALGVKRTSKGIETIHPRRLWLQSTSFQLHVFRCQQRRTLTGERSLVFMSSASLHKVSFCGFHIWLFYHASSQHLSCHKSNNFLSFWSVAGFGIFHAWPKLCTLSGNDGASFV